MMAGEHKSHKEVGHWPYLAIVTIVAVVAVVILVLQTDKGETYTEVVDYSIPEGEENIVGDAKAKPYGLLTGDQYRACFLDCRNGDTNPDTAEYCHDNCRSMKTFDSSDPAGDGKNARIIMRN